MVACAEGAQIIRAREVQLALLSVFPHVFFHFATLFHYFARMSENKIDKVLLAQGEVCYLDTLSVFLIVIICIATAF
jgi:hypothetical protein